MFARPVLCIALTTLVSQAVASTNVQFFPDTNCEPGTTSLPVYTSDKTAAEDADCKSAPGGTIAVWVESLDDGCTVRTFSSQSCADALGSPITPGTCYFSPPSPDPVPILSWNIVCGGQSSADTGSLESVSDTPSDGPVVVDATVVVSPSGNASSTSILLTTTTAPTNSSMSRITGTGTGGMAGNSTGPATWSNTLTPGTSRTSEEVSPVTVDAVGNDGDGGNANVGPATGNAAAGRSKGKVETAMLVVGSLLGLSWGVLW